MNPRHERQDGTADRRATRRRDSAARIRLSIEASELDGRADNISETGILFLTEDSLRVVVEMEENGTRRRRAGRLIRAQVMEPGKIGWAVEFDRE